MKAQFKVTGRLIVEVEGGDQKDLFKQLAVVQEVFGEDTCGKCKGTDVKFVNRNVEDNDFYEIQCRKCGAKIAFGSHKKGGTLFPKRKDEAGNWIGSNGWGKWNVEKKVME